MSQIPFLDLNSQKGLSPDQIEFDLYVFDFDITLLSPKSEDRITLHRYHDIQDTYLQNGPQGLQWLQQDFPYYLFFRNLVKHLLDNNKKVAIASFSSKERILSYLNVINLANGIFHFENIKTPADYKGYHEGQAMPDKNQMIYDLSIYYGVPLEKIVLYDDNYHNIVSLPQNTTGIWVPHGFNPFIWKQQIENKLPVM